MIFRLMPILLSVLFVIISDTALAKDSQEDQIIVIGVNAMGQATSQAIPADLYKDTISTAVKAVNKAILPVLDKQHLSPMATEWNLDSIGVGLGLSATIGLGPLINYTINPQIKLVFTNDNDPVYPN
jgi:hypothetical protein